METWFDPMEMFRQIAPNGIVNRTQKPPIADQDLTSQLFGEDDAADGVEEEHLTAADGACPFIGKQ